MQRRDALKLGILATSAGFTGCGKRIVGEIDLAVDQPSNHFKQGVLSYSDEGFSTPLSSLTSSEIGQPWRDAVLNASSKVLASENDLSNCELAFRLMLAPYHPNAQQWASEAASQLEHSPHQADLILAEGIGVYCSAHNDDSHWQWLADTLERAAPSEQAGWYNFSAPTPKFEFTGRSLATAVMPMLRLKWLWRAYMKLAGQNIAAYDRAVEAQMQHIQIKQSIRYEYLNPNEVFWLLLPSGNHLSGFEAFSIFCALRSDLIAVTELPTLAPEISVHSIGVASIKQDVRQSEISLETHYHHALGTSLLRSLGRNTELKFDQTALALALNSVQEPLFGDIEIAKTYNASGSHDWFDGASNTLNAAALFGLLSGEHSTAWN